MVARHSEYSTRMENDRGRGEGSVPDQTREGETQVIRGKGEKRRKEREEWPRRMGETFTLRPKMKIVLLDALRRGQRTRHIISALARVANATKTAVSSFFLDSYQCASSIIARLTARPIPASGSLSRISIHPGSSGKQRTLGMVTRRFLIKFVRSSRRLIIA